MNKEITDAIKKKAEEKYEVVPDPALPDIIIDRYEPLRESFKCGYSEAITDMLEFRKILSDDFEEYSGERWECLQETRCEKWGLQFETFYTTEQLLSKYINSLTDKID